MSDFVTLDEFIVTLKVPHNLSDVEVRKIRRVLKRKTFAAQLEQVVAEVCRRFVALNAVLPTVSR